MNHNECVAYAMFRLPEESHYTVVRQTSGAPVLIDDISLLGRTCGFVVAPFMTDSSHPAVVISPDEVTRHATPRLNDTDAAVRQDTAATSLSSTAEAREAYGQSFRRFHDALKRGDMEKAVLARRQSVALRVSHLETLFLKACNIYPRMMVALVSAPVCGTWLMATPEVLLRHDGTGTWQTMALAGTMPDTEEPPTWSQKNLHEQQLVADYITRRLSPLADNILRSDPRTVKAAHLLHLRTDFSFTLRPTVPQATATGALCKALHPTPAVCGMPQAEALHLISEAEPFPRTYYSGFCGMMSGDRRTDFYVSLRCMQIESDRCTLYAGGGLLADSDEQQEWEETEMKLDTMRRLLETD